MGGKGGKHTPKDLEHKEKENMGNLYTQLVRLPSNKRIELLSKLKQAWRTTPRDMELISKLQTELNDLKAKQNKKRKKWHGQFG